MLDLPAMLLAVGDVHGCHQTLKRLLRRAGWCAQRDRLWLTGDLVNRGLGSLAVLRWVHRNRDRVNVVLGNHDLHLLARAQGVAESLPDDQLDELLSAPDREDLLSWLRRQPLLHREERWILVHAGLWPRWSVHEACLVAREVSAGLDGPEPAELLSAYSRGVVLPWHSSLDPVQRLSTAAAILTLMRTVREDGHLDLSFTGPMSELPEGRRPWFESGRAAGTDTTILFGHWARLGYYRGRGVICLDSGCVYGGHLTAVRLDTGETFHQPVMSSDLPHPPRGVAESAQNRRLD